MSSSQVLRILSTFVWKKMCITTQTMRSNSALSISSERPILQSSGYLSCFKQFAHLPSFISPNIITSSFNSTQHSCDVSFECCSFLRPLCWTIALIHRKNPLNSWTGCATTCNNHHGPSLAHYSGCFGQFGNCFHHFHQSPPVADSPCCSRCMPLSPCRLNPVNPTGTPAFQWPYFAKVEDKGGLFYCYTTRF